ncbi:unnamed protein product [Aureobasidium uvarum]|uniref:Uncharacterized protein n=1 Tax=Aureobasidium uvarum TaxID=2773716 RepID=A0A9N8KP32_9PEZI|nr:unnamed protein product [Aureobasidium uvarum]
MTDNRIRDWFDNQIELQKQSSMHFSGKHNVAQPQSTAIEEEIDFDFYAQMSEFASLKTIQIRRLDIAENISMITAEEEIGENRLVQQAVEKLESITALGYERFVPVERCPIAVLTELRVAFDNVFINYDGMFASLKTWSKRARYGGRVKFDNENKSGPLDSGSYGGPRISVQAVWRYKWDKPKVQSTTRYALPTTPSIRSGPRPMTWDLRIQHAMVDGQKGAIGLEDETSGVPMIKAIAKYALHETLTMQGSFGTSRIHKWGLDEPNDEPPYVGARHLGGAARIELPPPYTE